MKHWRAQVAAHRPHDGEEAAHQAQVLALFDQVAAPWRRDHWAPGHLTASALVLSPERDAVLLILHSKLGLWLQPGGHVDEEDADLVAAARRELVEETGVDAEPIGSTPLVHVDVHEIPARPSKGEPTHQHHDLRVLLQATSRELNAGSDALAARWVRWAELETVDTDRSVRRAMMAVHAWVQREA